MSFAACDATDEAILAALGGGCVIDSDCEGELVCVFQRCHQACETSADCPRGQRCVLGEPPTHVCLLDDETECVRTSDCPQTLVCGVDLRCRDECQSDPDCITDQTCAQRTCALDEELEDGELPTEAPDDVVPCVFSSDCPALQRCVDGLCRFECTVPEDCPSRNCDPDTRRCKPGSNEPVCVPGQQEACACPVGGQGVQICEPDGMAFGACLGCATPMAGPCDPVMGATDPSFRYAFPLTFGATSQSIRDMAVTPNGELVVAASVSSFQGATDFGGMSYTATDGGDAVVARYGSNGTLQGLYPIDVGNLNGIVEVGAIGATDNGEIWAAGTYGNGLGPPNFGVGNLPPGVNGVFLARFDGNGTPVFATGFTVSSMLGAGIFELAVGPMGHVAIWGTYYGTIDFGSGPITSPGPSDAGSFIALFDAAGTNLFTRSFELAGANGLFGAQLAVNGVPQVMMSSSFQGTVDFGSGPKSAVDTIDRVLAVYDASGAPLFDTPYDGTGPMDALFIGAPAVDANDDFLVVGSYEGVAPPDFGSGTLPTGMGTVMFDLIMTPNGTVVPMSEVITPNAGAGAVFLDTLGNRVFAGGLSQAPSLGPCNYGAGVSRSFFARRTPGGVIDWVRTLDTNLALVNYAVSPDDDTIVALLWSPMNMMTSEDFGGGTITGSHFVVKLDPTLPP